MRQATASDLPVLMDLRIEAERWLSAAGVDQWRDPRTRGPALRKWEADIEAGRTWIAATSAGDVLGTVTLARPDRDFWTQADQPDSAVYVGKLITARAAAGLDLGGRILDWVGSIARDRNLPWVRLDCWRDNTRLQDYYLRRGFRHVRTEAPAHRLSGWMAQRPASVTLHPGNELTTAASADPASAGSGAPHRR
ncbi:GNAT family N-acetyltransferase [Streptomyces syringium]|uniref:GNAT family N-acetyltransferase n=1 Tax=Streptomyces syringium TaxID=76729 RepID=UPI0037D878C9